MRYSFSRRLHSLCVRRALPCWCYFPRCSPRWNQRSRPLTARRPFQTIWQRVAEWTRDVVDLSSANGAEDVVAAVARAIQKTIAYRRREAKGVQTPTLTLDESSGSCRDMATLMLEALRAFGLPARFASGYLDCAASEAGRASTHAVGRSISAGDWLDWLRSHPRRAHLTQARCCRGEQSPRVGSCRSVARFYDEQGSYLGMKVSVRIERFETGTELHSRI